MYIVYAIQRPEDRVEHAKDVRMKMLCAFKKHWQAKLFLHKEAVRELRLLLVSDASMTEEQRERIEKLESPLLSSAPLKDRQEPYTLIYNQDDSSSVDLVQVVRGWSSTYGAPVKTFRIEHCPMGAEQEPEAARPRAVGTVPIVPRTRFLLAQCAQQHPAERCRHTCQRAALERRGGRAQSSALHASGACKD